MSQYKYITVYVHLKKKKRKLFPYQIEINVHFFLKGSFLFKKNKQTKKTLE